MEGLRVIAAGAFIMLSGCATAPPIDDHGKQIIDCMTSALERTGRAQSIQTATKRHFHSTSWLLGYEFRDHAEVLHTVWVEVFPQPDGDSEGYWTGDSFSSPDDPGHEAMRDWQTACRINLLISMQ